MPGLMTAVDIVSRTSNTEGLPAIVLEAMSLGRAIASTDIGGVAAVVRDGGSHVTPEAPDVSVEMAMEFGKVAWHSG